MHGTNMKNVGSGWEQEQLMTSGMYDWISIIQCLHLPEIIPLR